jgi:topoisomerase-4 subunit A
MTGLRGLYRQHFMDYASYVIKERAIPDAADGLKPVQRRILWAMREMDDGRFNKVANVIGHCMRYHPHGDQSIGAALVALANRGYFIEGQGNFGNILTGDEASASRYIECRLTQLARDTLFNPDITEFIPSYDGRNQEPVLFPAKIPVLLLLGAEGIAVGMSTRILPHNFNEVIQAQIACLRGEGFSLLPDFPQGGAIDVSAYDDGNGRIRNRARIEPRGGKKLVISEIPFGTTTETLMASIENATRKGRLKITSIDDYTTENVEIEITPARGVSAQETLRQLYAHTECEVVHTSNMLVIREGAPVETTVSGLVEYSAEMLLHVLRLELQLEIRNLDDTLHWMTLEQVFIENRLYKLIEECPTLEEVREAVVNGLRPFLADYPREVTPEDIDRLLALKIRRISRFDIEAHRREMDDIRAKTRLAKKRLGHLKDYAVEVLGEILKKYGKLYPRKTAVEGFSGIQRREVAIANLRVGFDRETGFVGTAVKGGDAWSASEYDRILFFLGNGTYRVVPVQEKYLVDGEVLWCGPVEKDRLFTCVYRDRTDRIPYAKRFGTGGFILDREYRFVPDECEVLLFHEGSDVTLEYWFERRKRMKTRKGQTSAADIPEKGVKARGVRLCGTRTISSIKAVAATTDTEDAPEPAPEPEATVSDPAPAALSLEEVEARAEELNRKLRNIVEKYEMPDLFEGRGEQDKK